MVWLSKRRYILLMLLPTLLVYVGYIILPVLISFYYSFTSFNGIGKAQFVGFDNYARLWEDSLFWVSLKNTMIILGISFVFLLPCSFLLSLMLNREIKGSNVLKAINFAPGIIAPILVGLIWMFILDPQIGFINTLLQQLGFQNASTQWIGGKTLTPYSVGFVYSWQVLGFIATIFLAGLKMVPRDVYESSSIDGANKRQQLFFVTIPMLNETFKINIVLIITGAFKIFETVFMLTKGGPNHLSEVMVTYMYNITFSYSEYGYGMALAVVTFLLTIVFSFLYLMIVRKAKRD
jgi:raffinose/stachyose/melibiose transport system permease protein